MTRKDDLRRTRAALASAKRLMTETETLPVTETKTPRGRPPGGVSQAAREAGLPEATYRRRLRRVGLQEHAAVVAAIDAAPVALSAAALLRVSRHATEAAMLVALEAEIGARMAPRPPGALDRLQAENDRLRHRVAELEAELDLRPNSVKANDMSDEARMKTFAEQRLCGIITALTHQRNLPVVQATASPPPPLAATVAESVRMMREHLTSLE